MCEKEDVPSEKLLKKRTEIKNKRTNSSLGVTVEPTVFIVMFTSVMYQLVVQNLYLEKACRVELSYNQSICDAMTNRITSGYTKQQEEEVQKLASQMVALRTFIQGSIPFVVVIFAGSWSDRHNRRKPLIFLPIIGEIVCCVLLILNTIFFYELPLIYTTLGDSIPYAIAGGWSCFGNGIYSYVGSTTRDEDKTVKMGIVTAVHLSGALLGSSAGGLFYKIFGFVPFFIMCIILFVIAFIFGCFLLCDDGIKTNKVKPIEIIQDIFSIKNILCTFQTAFKSGPNKRRYKVIAVILVFLSVAGPFNGELYMNYLYTRLRFSWDAVQYGTFTSIQVLIQVFGSVVSVLFFVKILHWEDTFLGMISIIGSSISNFIFAFAPSGNYLYIGIVGLNILFEINRKKLLVVAGTIHRHSHIFMLRIIR
ncbi:hypothetical protein WA026_021361 [Henosepilachna vigintioctopunctata]|uniref:Proton-coupled folate transporter n=1 Tax=Henosepilachna vigintioctopunctata TaxID=420089 RepID=A0AAW1TY56_9CUCU